ncbi:putative helix-turn-helix protein YlxM/p13 family protein [Halothermothrix orenii H 168]|uniref:UPF0122 protein Hore_07280 n=1 Tax=Halothermothrix orenii (strain H 168 / OCM 544 / DSM 9562) TaxID=373903 RepID=B8CW16_HALOH|nr:putative helix-turn-helix protein YlxM/p13 family protein [Halothermothrix orenii H 168]
MTSGLNYSKLSSVKFLYLTQLVICLLEKVIEMGMLFDFYGKLLTDRQQEVIYLYYYRDLSLGEIAEQLDISRQGVYDHIHRGEEVLKSYEQKLGLVSKYKRLKKELDGLSRYISDNKNINKTVKKDLLCRIDKISKEV